MGALAVSVQYKLLIGLFGVVFPLMGFAIGVQVTYMHLVETALWWGDRINVGHAMTGGASALGSLSWTLCFGELLEALGHEQVTLALWVFCGIHVTAVIG